LKSLERQADANSLLTDYTTRRKQQFDRPVAPFFRELLIASEVN
jgi:hypothetical protein